MAYRLTRQPQQALPLDRSNPLGAKVIEHISLRGGASSLLGAPVTYGAGGSTVAGIKGRSLRGAGASGRASVQLNLTKYSVITVAFWMYWDSYANNDALAMEMGTAYGANNGFLIDPNCSSPAAFMFGSGDGPSNNLVTFPRPGAGAWHRIVLTMDRAAAAGTSSTAYVDGVAQPISAFPGASPVTGNFGSDTLHLFSRNESSLLGIGNLQDITFYRGALSAAEAVQDYQNPYQIFKARSSAYQASIASASDPAGGTATNVNPGPGTLSLTGYAPTVDRGAAVAVSPAAAALSIAGYAPSVLQPHAVAPGAVAVSIAGYAPSITQSATVSVAPGVGALSLTGYAPAVMQGLAQNIALSTAGLTITGYLPAVAQSAVRRAAPGPAAVTLTGYAPTVVRGASLNLPVGAAAGLVLTGYAPSISQTVGIPLSPGNVAITGYAPHIEQAIVVTIQPCALGITGYAPSVHLMRSFLNVPAPASRTIAMPKRDRTITMPKQDRAIMLKGRPNKIRM